MDKVAWQTLQRDHFPELPMDCGNTVDPGLHDTPDLRDWSQKATTPDQLRMENYVSRYDLTGKRILHIGVGSSGLARRFHRRTAEIVGTSVDQAEVDRGHALGLANYTVILQNKYTSDPADGLGQFDFIFDNNPASMCCCLTHLAHLLDYYSAKLRPGGQVVTDRIGLDWIPDLPGTNPRWRFDFADLQNTAKVADLKAYRIDQNVYVLAQDAPEHPSAKALAWHWARRIGNLPAQAFADARMLARRLRKILRD